MLKKGKKCYNENMETAADQGKVDDVANMMHLEKYNKHILVSLVKLFVAIIINYPMNSISKTTNRYH